MFLYTLRFWPNLGKIEIFSYPFLHNNPRRKRFNCCEYFRVVFFNRARFMALSGGLNTFGKKILCLLTAEALYRQIDGRTDKQQWLHNSALVEQQLAASRLHTHIHTPSSPKSVICTSHASPTPAVYHLHAQWAITGTYTITHPHLHLEQHIISKWRIMY